MRVQIGRWGNSLVVPIPRSIAAELRIEAGAVVELSVEGGTLIICPVTRPEITLGGLLEQVTPENLHEETPTGPAVGAEVW